MASDDHHLPRDTNVIADEKDLVDALVMAIVDGSHELSQRIVDELGERGRAAARHV